MLFYQVSAWVLVSLSLSPLSLSLSLSLRTSSIMEGQITCISPAFDGAVPFTGTVVVHIDNADVDNNVQFMYRNNPNFTEVRPTVTIPA